MYKVQIKIDDMRYDRFEDMRRHRYACMAEWGLILIELISIAAVATVFILATR